MVFVALFKNLGIYVTISLNFKGINVLFPFLRLTFGDLLLYQMTKLEYLVTYCGWTYLLIKHSYVSFSQASNLIDYVILEQNI